MQYLLKFIPMSLVIILDILYIINCFSPYLGIKYQFSQAMYSYLGYHGENHILSPRLSVFKNDTYVHVKDIKIKGVETKLTKDFLDFINWAKGNGSLIHHDFLRYHFNKFCYEHKAEAIMVAYTTHEGDHKTYINACEDERMLSYSPLYLYPTCSPDCLERLLEWVR